MTSYQVPDQFSSKLSMKNKKILKTCHNQEDPGEIWQLKAVWLLDEILGQKKNIREKLEKSL